MSMAYPLQTGLIKRCDRGRACARERTCNWSAARTAANWCRLPQDDVHVHVECSAVADGNMSMSYDDLRGAELDNGKVL